MTTADLVSAERQLIAAGVRRAGEDGAVVDERRWHGRWRH